MYVCVSGCVFDHVWELFRTEKRKKYVKKIRVIAAKSVDRVCTEAKIKDFLQTGLFILLSVVRTVQQQSTEFEIGFCSRDFSFFFCLFLKFLHCGVHIFSFF